MNVIEDIRKYMDEQLNVAEATSVDAETALVREGIIDSIELMQIVAFLEERFKIEVDETEILPANLRNLNTMDAFIRGKIANQ